jgi:hypothetical protein
MPQAPRRGHGDPGGEEYSEGRRSMQDDQTAQDANFAKTEFYEVRCQKIATRKATWHMTQPLCPFILALVG